MESSAPLTGALHRVASYLPCEEAAIQIVAVKVLGAELTLRRAGNRRVKPTAAESFTRPSNSVVANFYPLP